MWQKKTGGCLFLLIPGGVTKKLFYIFELTYRTKLMILRYAYKYKVALLGSVACFLTAAFLFKKYDQSFQQFGSLSYPTVICANSLLVPGVSLRCAKLLHPWKVTGPEIKCFRKDFGERRFNPLILFYSF